LFCLGSEEESESPLETAVRKVVSYKMTPKQALAIYNLTPKVKIHFAGYNPTIQTVFCFSDLFVLIACWLFSHPFFVLCPFCNA